MCIWGASCTRQSCVFILLDFKASLQCYWKQRGQHWNKNLSQQIVVLNATVYDQLLEPERIQSLPYIPLVYSHACVFYIDCYQIKGNHESVAISFFVLFCFSSNSCQPASAVSRRTEPATDTAAPQRGTTESVSRHLADKWTWKYEVFPLDSSIRSAFAVYSVCKCILKEKKTFCWLLLCMRFFLSRNSHNIMTMEDPYPHTSVTINWTSLRQLHLIWPPCLRKAFSPRREPLGVFALVQERKTEEKWPQQHIHVTYEVTLRTNLATNDNTLTSANV